MSQNNKGRPGISIYTTKSWPAFELFQTCATQWRLSPGGERVALDYTAVIAVAQFLGLGSDILQEVRYLELGAITAHRGGNLEDTLYGS